jgi:hypothetical protein
MKKNIIYVSLLLTLTLFSSCEKWLDVNTNPNGPEKVTANLYLAPILSSMVLDGQQDSRFVGRYIQNWTLTSSGSVWDAHGHEQNTTTPDNGMLYWRTVYYNLGQNLVDMMTAAEAEQRWDLLGVGYAIKAWGWLTATDMYGEIIVKQAFDVNRTRFDYDSQQYAYQETERCLRLAIDYLGRTDGAVNQAFLAKGDIFYGGNREKWRKFAYGLLAVTLSHYSNRPELYKPNDVIAAVDASFSSNADDALLQFVVEPNDQSNYLGPRRGNITTYRQTSFIVSLLNGTALNGTSAAPGLVDPRMTRMLAAAPDGSYRGLEAGSGESAITPTTARPQQLWGANGTGPAVPGKYIFNSAAKYPLLTYSQLQFIKAEAAFRANDKQKALDAYKAALNAHFDFVNARTTDAQYPSLTPISSAERNTFLADPKIVPTSANNLTLTMIMCQKYIAQWIWNFEETWTDMRRYHYTDKDPATNEQVYVGFKLPATFFADNVNKPAQRLRPRFNSEYVWNRAGLDAVGGLAIDYQTKPLWITP